MCLLTAAKRVIAGSNVKKEKKRGIWNAATQIKCVTALHNPTVQVQPDSYTEYILHYIKTGFTSTGVFCDS